MACDRRQGKKKKRRGRGGAHGRDQRKNMNGERKRKPVGTKSINPRDDGLKRGDLERVSSERRAHASQARTSKSAAQAGREESRHALPIAPFTSPRLHFWPVPPITGLFFLPPPVHVSPPSWLFFELFSVLTRLRTAELLAQTGCASWAGLLPCGFQAATA